MEKEPAKFLALLPLTPKLERLIWRRFERTMKLLARAIKKVAKRP